MQAATARQNQRDGMEAFQTVNESAYSELYGLRTCSHPALLEFEDWYETGEKRFPDDLTLTPTVCRAWYVCDGWLASEPYASWRVMIKVTNESDRFDFLVDLFEEQGFDVGFSREAVQVYHEESKRLFDWIGSPPPGFRYKWPDGLTEYVRQ